MTEADIQPLRRVSAVWIIPLIALVIAAWTLIQTYLSRGPEIEITFASAAGLKAGETQVKLLDVDIGVVEEVRLAPDYEGIIAVARLAANTSDLLTEDAQFWVVRPRIGTEGISGLSTLLSGAYIEIAPGEGVTGRRVFQGLDEVPVTPPSAPGLQIQLLSDGTASVNVGSPVLYNGFRVGRIEEVRLDETGQSHFTAFVDAPYDDLITSGTRFWNASGLAVDVGGDGFNLRTESLEALVTGGVAFALPEGAAPGQGVNDGAFFYLFDNVQEVLDHPHFFAREYLLLFETSVRGLNEGAPVEYRGMRVGTVMQVGHDRTQLDTLWTSATNAAVPVHIHLEPGWLGDDTEAGADAFATALEQAVERGLRGSLAVSNLLTGNLFVALDIHEDAPQEKLEALNGLRVLPTRSTGLSQIEDKVVALLDKLRNLPLEDTLLATEAALSSMQSSLADAGSTLETVDALLKKEDTQALPAHVVATLEEMRGLLGSFANDSPTRIELENTLRQLQQTLRGADALIETYEQKPNAIIFPAKATQDPVPGEQRAR